MNVIATRTYATGSSNTAHEISGYVGYAIFPKAKGKTRRIKEIEQWKIRKQAREKTADES
jgi:hypothetical protein